MDNRVIDPRVVAMDSEAYLVIQDSTGVIVAELQFESWHKAITDVMLQCNGHNQTMLPVAVEHPFSNKFVMAFFVSKDIPHHLFLVEHFRDYLWDEMFKNN